MTDFEARLKRLERNDSDQKMGCVDAFFLLLAAAVIWAGMCYCLWWMRDVERRLDKLDPPKVEATEEPKK